MARNILLIAGILCGLIGAVQVWQGMPGYYSSRGIADLQADANATLLSIAWLIGGLACGVFALAFTPPPPGARPDAPPDPSQP